jgi:hypothetical protein
MSYNVELYSKVFMNGQELRIRKRLTVARLNTLALHFTGETG